MPPFCRRTLCCFILFAIFPVMAGAGPIVSGASSSQAVPNAQTAIPLAVLEFRIGPGVDANIATAVASRLREDLFNVQGYSIIDKSHMKTILEEQKLALKLCSVDDSSCLIQVGKQLAVSEMVIGRMIFQDGAFLISLDHTETDSAKVLHTTNRFCKCDLPELMALMDTVASEWFPAKTARVDVNPRLSAPEFVEPAIVPVGRPQKEKSVTAKTMRYGGAVLGVLGASLAMYEIRQGGIARTRYEVTNQDRRYYEDSLGRVKTSNRAQIGGWSAFGVGALCFGLSWSLP